MAIPKEKPKESRRNHEGINYTRLEKVIKKSILAAFMELKKQDMKSLATQSTWPLERRKAQAERMKRLNLRRNPEETTKKSRRNPMSLEQRKAQDEEMKRPNLRRNHEGIPKKPRRDAMFSKPEEPRRNHEGIQSGLSPDLVRELKEIKEQSRLIRAGEHVTEDRGPDSEPPPEWI